MSSPSLLPISVLIAEPNDVGRAGLRALLSADPRFNVVGETADAVVPLPERLQPDLVVLDPSSDGELNPDRIAAAAAASPNSHICVRTAAVALGPMLAAMDAGALGYLLKTDASCPFLEDALVLVGRYGAAVTGPSVVRRLREQRYDQSLTTIQETPAIRLTDREREVLALIVEGLSYKEIGEQLGIAEGTVSMHVQHMLDKTGAKSRNQLCYLAGRDGLT